VHVANHGLLLFAKGVMNLVKSLRRRPEAASGVPQEGGSVDRAKAVPLSAPSFCNKNPAKGQWLPVARAFALFPRGFWRGGVPAGKSADGAQTFRLDIKMNG
jgi:hypothetical protein